MNCTGYSTNESRYLYKYMNELGIFHSFEALMVNSSQNENSVMIYSLKLIWLSSAWCCFSSNELGPHVQMQRANTNGMQGPKWREIWENSPAMNALCIVLYYIDRVLLCLSSWWNATFHKAFRPTVNLLIIITFWRIKSNYLLFTCFQLSKRIVV